MLKYPAVYVLMNHLLPSLVVIPLLGGICACSQVRYGSVSAEVAQVAISCPRLLVTPRLPRWLLRPDQVHLLPPEKAAAVRSLLSADKVRKVPETYYRTESQGNRGDESKLLFYVYPNNGQCLGGRIIGRKVLMDDYVLAEQECKALYELLLPELQMIHPKQGLRLATP